MITVITPTALANSKTYRQIKREDLLAEQEQSWDEAYLFLFPSESVLNEANGDGDLIEIEDFSTNFRLAFTSYRKAAYPINDSTIIYVR